MSEPESLATIEGVDEHLRRHSYDRLIMLSDGIFAIATTLAALDIRLPAHSRNLLALLVDGRRGLLAYVLSFAVAGIVWVSNRNLFARLRRVDAVLTVLTLAMLACIALIPAAIRTVYLEGGGEADFQFYGLTMFVCGLLNLTMWAYAGWRPGLMLAGVGRSERLLRAGYAAIMPILFLPMILLPIDRYGPALLPFLGIVLVVRRVLLPRWLGPGAARQHA